MEKFLKLLQNGLNRCLKGENKMPSRRRFKRRIRSGMAVGIILGRNYIACEKPKLLKSSKKAKKRNKN